MTKPPMLMYWCGKPVDELDRNELLTVISHLGAELERMRTERNRWMSAGDPLKYLMQKEQA